ncbi:hypothetical protein cypCar_00009344 [Cyprinus carpio]|nr:hypothetical protein cypCar_00009344 [Cyprinus carpio]
MRCEFLNWKVGLAIAAHCKSDLGTKHVTQEENHLMEEKKKKKQEEKKKKEAAQKKLLSGHLTDRVCHKLLKHLH